MSSPAPTAAPPRPPGDGVTRCALLEADVAPPWVLEAIEAGGGELVDLGDADALLLWRHPPRPEQVLEALARGPRVRWVQLCSSGVDRYVDVLAAADREVLFTCGRGVYSEPVAEHALALALAGLRELTARARTTEWGEETTLTLFDAPVTCIGGGGITEAFTRLLAPFRAEVTVVRRTPRPMEGVARVLPPSDLHRALDGALVVLVAVALTDETAGMLGAAELEVMRSDGILVNVARGAIIDQDALCDALRDGRIGGALLDATTPEPLPPDHPLWTFDTCLITPHVAVGHELGDAMLGTRFEENLRRFGQGRDMVGVVDLELGY